MIQTVESIITDGNIDDLKVADLKAYLKLNGLNDKGRRDELMNRVFVFISEKTSIWKIGSKHFAWLFFVYLDKILRFTDLSD